MNRPLTRRELAHLCKPVIPVRPFDTTALGMKGFNVPLCLPKPAAAEPLFPALQPRTPLTRRLILWNVTKLLLLMIIGFAAALLVAWVHTTTSVITELRSAKVLYFTLFALVVVTILVARDVRWWFGLSPKGIQKPVPVGPLVTVIIPAHGEQDSLARTIRSVLKEPHLDRILAVDDGSTDYTEERIKLFVKKYPGKVVLVKRKKASGQKAGAINAVLLDPTIKRAPFTAIIDADTTLRNTFAPMLSHFYNPRVAGVSARVVAGKPKNGRRSYGRSAKVGENDAGHFWAKPAHRHVRAIPVSAGCCSIFRSEVMDRFEEVEAEDMEFSMRVSKKYDLSYAEDAVCISEEPSNMRIFIKQRIRWIKGALQCYQMHILHGDMWKKNPKLWLMCHYEFLKGLMGLPLFVLLMITATHTALAWVFKLFGVTLDPYTEWLLAMLSPIVLNLLVLTVTLMISSIMFARLEGRKADLKETRQSIIPTFLGTFVVQGVFWYCLQKVFFPTKKDLAKQPNWVKGR